MEQGRVIYGIPVSPEGLAYGTMSKEDHYDYAAWTDSDCGASSCNTTPAGSLQNTPRGSPVHVPDYTVETPSSSDYKKSTQNLRNLFHLPLAEAARHLGICATGLKKLCRRKGIARWPYRKLKCLQRVIDEMEKDLDQASKSGDLKRKDLIEQHVRELRERREMILQNPGTNVPTPQQIDVLRKSLKLGKASSTKRSVHEAYESNPYHYENKRRHVWSEDTTPVSSVPTSPRLTSGYEREKLDAVALAAEALHARHNSGRFVPSPMPHSSCYDTSSFDIRSHDSRLSIQSIAGSDQAGATAPSSAPASPRRYWNSPERVRVSLPTNRLPVHLYEGAPDVAPPTVAAPPVASDLVFSRPTSTIALPFQPHELAAKAASTQPKSPPPRITLPPLRFDSAEDDGEPRLPKPKPQAEAIKLAPMEPGQYL